VNSGADGSYKVIHDVTLMCLVIISLSLLSLSNPVFAADTINLPPVKGDKLPVISLPIPKNLEEKNYLGLSGEGFFKISQIKAKDVLINIFSLYCPICQGTASAVVEMYDRIENNPGLKNKIKLIGIGAGNTVLEVDIFKQTYHIPFPMFPDENFKIHQALGEVRTPFFIAVRMNGDGSYEIVHTHLGGLTDARAFLDLIVEAYGLKREELLIKEVISSPNASLSENELK
jgi:peroxiredoxin